MTQFKYDQSIGLTVPENYERYFVQAIGRPIAEDLIRLADVQSGEKVLDVACGTGIVTRLAAEKTGPSGSITGLDKNPGMLAVARSVVDTEVPVDWHEAGAEEMPLPDKAFDVVFCQAGLQFVEDKPAALNEMNRVLADPGRVYINMPGKVGEVFAIFLQGLNDHISAEAAGAAGKVFSLNDTEELRQLMENAGFKNVNVSTHEKTFELPPPGDFLWQYIHSTPLAGVVPEVGEEHQQALERDVVQKWKNFEQNGGMIYRQQVLTATGEKLQQT